MSDLSLYDPFSSPDFSQPTFADPGQAPQPYVPPDQPAPDVGGDGAPPGMTQRVSGQPAGNPNYGGGNIAPSAPPPPPVSAPAPFTSADSLQLQKLQQAMAKIRNDKYSGVIDDSTYAQAQTQLQQQLAPLLQAQEQDQQQGQIKAKRQMMDQMATTESIDHVHSVTQAKNVRETVAEYTDPFTGKTMQFFQPERGTWKPLEWPEADKSAAGDVGEVGNAGEAGDRGEAGIVPMKDTGDLANVLDWSRAAPEAIPAPVQPEPMEDTKEGPAQPAGAPEAIPAPTQDINLGGQKPALMSDKDAALWNAPRGREAMIRQAMAQAPPAEERQLWQNMLDRDQAQQKVVGGSILQAEKENPGGLSDNQLRVLRERAEAAIPKVQGGGGGRWVQ